MEMPIISYVISTFIEIRENALVIHSIRFDIFILDDITL